MEGVILVLEVPRTERGVERVIARLKVRLRVNSPPLL